MYFYINVQTLKLENKIHSLCWKPQVNNSKSRKRIIKLDTVSQNYQIYFKQQIILFHVLSIQENV